MKYFKAGYCAALFALFAAVLLDLGPNVQPAEAQFIDGAGERVGNVIRRLFGGGQSDEERAEILKELQGEIDALNAKIKAAEKALETEQNPERRKLLEKLIEGYKRQIQTLEQNIKAALKKWGKRDCRDVREILEAEVKALDRQIDRLETALLECKLAGGDCEEIQKQLKELKDKRDSIRRAIEHLTVVLAELDPGDVPSGCEVAVTTSGGNTGTTLMTDSSEADDDCSAPTLNYYQGM